MQSKIQENNKAMARGYPYGGSSKSSRFIGKARWNEARVDREWG
jgi:hypothetical protein